MIRIDGYDFEGPWELGQTFNNVPGVYVIYTNQVWLDVGETDKLGDRINGDNHKRKPEWLKQSGGYQIYIAFLRVENYQSRLAIESKLRLALQPVCGGR